MTKAYSRGGLFGGDTFRAVDDVSFSLSADRAEIFTIVGESGSGKTTLSRMILNLVAPTAGAILFRGSDVTRAGGRSARMRFMAAVQPIFQNPFEAFNPLNRVDRYLLTTARHFCGARKRADAERDSGRSASQGGPLLRRDQAGASRTSFLAVSCSASR